MNDRPWILGISASHNGSACLLRGDETRGFGFLDRLIIQERDRSILPNLDYALGGLRQGIHYSEIRTDFVQHSLSAISYLRSSA